ncbi:halocyanin domain-containing protein [Halorubrum sp. DTA98]|uniref:halocyanin domain-containing protein n=1 Tax=Halorubrum sp. DTA98 TaxID=3402163 RepID=UPI003AAD79AE
MSTDDVSRRTFMRTAGGAAAAAGAALGASGTAAGQEDDGEEDEGDDGGGDVVPDWPTAAEGNLGTYEDARGQDDVTVMVGADDDGLAFDATLLWVDPGTTITFEWTGQGGGHNVETVEGEAALDSGDPVDEEGYTYTYETSEDDEGITHYHCAPHDAVGMHGGLAVGDDIPTEAVGDGGGAGAVFVPQGARALGIATFIAMVSTLGLAFVFMKYGGTITQE